jgi:type III pantothenate kinase
MTPDVIVDIGNSRMKWGRVESGRITRQIALPLDDPSMWTAAAAKARTLGPVDHWAFTGVVPEAIDRFENWLIDSQFEYHFLTNAELLSRAKPFSTIVREPDRIGIDRLLNAYAAHCRCPKRVAIAISVGTAMTIDAVLAEGVHIGGAILPGPAIMSRSLHEETAQLPPIVMTRPHYELGIDTESAISCGISAALRGAADLLVSQCVNRHGPASIVITGGGSPMFAGFTFTAETDPAAIDDTLTLDGILRVMSR